MFKISSRLLLAALLLLGPAVGGAAAGEPEPRIYHELADFTLTDSSGRAFTSTDLRGKVWVAVFFLTRCKGPCPLLLSRLAAAAKELDGSQVRVAAVTVDPDHDTPDVLHRFRLSFDDRWIFLTGSKDSIAPLLRVNFKVGFSDAPEAHSTNLVLIDRAGRIRGYYSGIREEDLSRLKADARALTAAP